MPNVRLISLPPSASRAWRIGPWTAQMPGLKTSATLGTERGCPLTAHPDRVEATR